MSFIFVIIVGGYWLCRLIFESMLSFSARRDSKKRMEAYHQFNSEFSDVWQKKYYIHRLTGDEAARLYEIIDSIPCLSGERFFKYSNANYIVSNNQLVNILLRADDGYIDCISNYMQIPGCIQTVRHNNKVLSLENRLEIGNWIKRRLLDYGAYIDVYIDYDHVYAHHKIKYKIDTSYPIKRIDPHDNQHP